MPDLRFHAAEAASKEEIAAFIARAAEKGTAARTAEEEKQAWSGESKRQFFNGTFAR